MALQTFALNTGRINKFKGAILAHAVPAEVLGRTGPSSPDAQEPVGHVCGTSFLALRCNVHGPQHHQPLLPGRQQLRPRNGHRQSAPGLLKA